MEVASIKGDTVLLIYHPNESTAGVGQQFKIIERPDNTAGLVVQVIANESLEYAGLQQEMIQKILEQQIATVSVPLDRETGMGEIKSLKIAVCKIRKRIQDATWIPWDGWIPTRNVIIEEITSSDLLGNVLPAVPIAPLSSFAEFYGDPIQIDGARLDMVNVVAGVKGAGKSHLAKHLVLALARKKVPCIIFDLNGEYVGLPQAQVFRWGDNFKPNLAEFGYGLLSTVIQTVYPLPENSRNVFSTRIHQIFAEARSEANKAGVKFQMSINYLRQQMWGGGQYVEDAIDRRLELIQNMNLFGDEMVKGKYTSILDAYDDACDGKPIVFDLRELTSGLQQALVKAMNDVLETICEKETKQHTYRYPYVFFEEAHFYIREDSIINIITRGRHIGMASVFVTNTPEKLPDTVFRQLDNLFLMGLTHRDDIRNVSKNSFTDQETIQSFATRMPKHHTLIMGNVTERYPLVVKVEKLPENVPTSGETKSTWKRFSSTDSEDHDGDE